jgi:hypothetical protein
VVNGKTNSVNFSSIGERNQYPEKITYLSQVTKSDENKLFMYKKQTGTSIFAPWADVWKFRAAIPKSFFLVTCDR